MVLFPYRISEVFVFLVLWNVGDCSTKDHPELAIASLESPLKLVETHHFEGNEKRHSSLPLSLFRNRRVTGPFNYTWPIKRVAEIDGDVILGGLMMIHEREDRRICGPIMPQGGIQALECMLYTMDWVNNQKDFLPGIKLGAYVLDDCDKDTYGLEQAVDFIKVEASLGPYSPVKKCIKMVEEDNKCRQTRVVFDPNNTRDRPIRALPETSASAASFYATAGAESAKKWHSRVFSVRIEAFKSNGWIVSSDND
ncbi:Metabotropic glutamate receptor 2 [Araneus ventricosus]|uniref:Metabotropic glutamate receptor 2 n=1 Tax=Araneus ventricosus TaxID=182803 RepID=A0A4Y2Q0Z2_ARAVE|nr:Metabotropic glutamate receptor 2 [Araneus ventricosus]